MAQIPPNRKNHGITSPEHESVQAAGVAGISAAGAGQLSHPDEALTTISLIKGCERWTFHWESGDEASLINRIAEMARDPSVPFDWYDAAVVCKHIAQPFKS